MEDLSVHQEDVFSSFVVTQDDVRANLGSKEQGQGYASGEWRGRRENPRRRGGHVTTCPSVVRMSTSLPEVPQDKSGQFIRLVSASASLPHH